MKVVNGFLAAIVAVCIGCSTVHSTRDGVTKPYRFEAAGGKIVQAEIGELVVPENRDKPGSRTIKLRFVRFPSTSGNPGSAIVYLAGGPGGSGIDAARGERFPLFMALREYGDVIAFDQRGTGESEPDLDCKEPYLLPFDEPLDPAAAGRAFAGAARQCAERLIAAGADLNGYDTLDSAADLEDLRKALGAEKLTLWGISYGTHLALATMRAFPASIDRAILAGLEPLRHTWKLPSDQQALLEAVDGLVKNDPAVRDAVPDLLGSIERLLASLAREPRSAPLTDPSSGMQVEMKVGADDLRIALAQMLGGPDAFRMMPDFIRRLEEGDWTALALMVARGRMGRAPNMMSTAMDCASGASSDWIERIRREAASTLLGDAINFPAPMICEGLPIRDLGDAYREALRSDIPVLLISGTLDGRTPVGNAEYVASTLPNSSHLVIEGAGHSSPLFLSSPEILTTMQRFLGGERIGNRRITAPPFTFIEPRRVANLTPETLARYAGTYRIADGDLRRVVPGGSVLFTIRGNGQPFPLRPMSETDFFYEGMSTRVEFELDASGKPSAMVVFVEGRSEGERAVRVEGAR